LLTNQHIPIMAAINALYITTDRPNATLIEDPGVYSSPRDGAIKYLGSIHFDNGSEIVLTLDADTRSEPYANPEGTVISLEAKGTGTIFYLYVTLAPDPRTWQFEVMSGGSTYTFRKGLGGSGHH
jgi:hypothetical protein